MPVGNVSECISAKSYAFHGSFTNWTTLANSLAGQYHGVLHLCIHGHSGDKMSRYKLENVKKCLRGFF